MKAPVTIENYHYKGFHGNDCFCPIHIWPELNLVIAEHSVNASPSPQQMVENIAENIIQNHKLNLKKLIWIDYVPAFCYSRPVDNFVSVNFEVNKSVFNSSLEFIYSSTTFDSINKETLEDVIAGSILLQSKQKVNLKFQ